MGDDSRHIRQDRDFLKQDLVNEDFRTADLPALSTEFIEEMMRNLSLERQRTHRQLERINKEIELIQLKMDSLKIVGGDLGSSVERISELNESGFNLSQKLEKIDLKLKDIRHQRYDSSQF
jgi:hypothetical protein